MKVLGLDLEQNWATVSCDAGGLPVGVSPTPAVAKGDFVKHSVDTEGLELSPTREGAAQGGAPPCGLPQIMPTRPGLPQNSLSSSDQV